MTVYSEKNLIFIDKDMFNDGLSLEAIGMMCCLIDMDTEITPEQLYELFPKESKETVDNALSELLRNGYIVMEE